MTANIQISGKSPSGVIFVVGGDTVDDFAINLQALTGSKDVADEIIRTAASLITPLSAGSTPPPAPSYQAQAQQNIQNTFPGAQPVQQQAPAGAPGPAPIGENGKPKRWVPPGVSKKTGKAYQGFWSEDRDRF